MNNNRFSLGPKMDRPRIKKNRDTENIKERSKNDSIYNKEEELKEFIPKEKYLAVGTKYKVKFIDYTHEGLAIAKIDAKTQDGIEYTNFPVFVFGGIVPEEAYIEIERLQSKFAYGKIIKVFEQTRSKNRVIPKCLHYGECGGCNLMHMDYKTQLFFKHEMVRKTFHSIAGLDDLNILPVIGMNKNNEYYYRNKVQVPVTCERGKTRCGFYKRDSHKVIPLDECYIQTSLSTQIIKFTRNVLVEYGVTGYDEKTHEGILRHILVRKNSSDTQYMIVIVTTIENFLEKDMLAQAIDKIINRYNMVTSIVNNINGKIGNVVIGNKNICLYGNDYITDTLCDNTFKIGATSFYQVNHEQCEKLYSTALNMASLNKEDILIDAYCGIGTIGIIASKMVKKVYGVEVVEEAIKNAVDNAKLNNVDNIEFVCEKAEKQIEKWFNDKIIPSIIVVDPPRKGCDQSLLDTIINYQIKKVLYISCDPATLARDVKILNDNGYSLSDIQPVDMFPHTNHIENIILLTRK